MTVMRSVADVLTKDVRFPVECIDRMFLNVYVPQLQYPAGLVGYVHRRLGLPIASTAPLARSPTRSAQRCTDSPATTPSHGSTSSRANARTT
jgi:hypothetical protein